MTKSLVIVGNGLLAETVYSYFSEFSKYRIEAFACDNEYIKGDSLLGLPLITIDQMYDRFESDETSIFVAIGYRMMNKIREKKYKDIKSKGYSLASFIHPNVKTWDSNTFGDNVLILEDNTIQPYTSFGNNTFLWSGNHIGHHSKVGKNCFISSQVVISGCCSIQDNTFMGVNSTLHDGITIGYESLIGAGTLITKSTKPQSVYLSKATKPFPKKSNQIQF